MTSNTDDVAKAWEAQKRSWNTFLGGMFDNQALYDIDNITKLELVQRYEEGCDIEEASSRWKEVVEQGGDREEFLDSLAKLEKQPDWPYHEPNALADIMSARPDSQHSYAIAGDLDDKILGAWLGRCGGCLLGKPVEGWSYEDIAEYLRAAGEWP